MAASCHVVDGRNANRRNQKLSRLAGLAHADIKARLHPNFTATKSPHTRAARNYRRLAGWRAGLRNG